jgi:hypothetical protein
MRLQKKDLYVFYMADRLYPYFQDAQNIRIVDLFVRLFDRDCTITFNVIPWTFLGIKTSVVKAAMYMLSKLQRLPWTLVLPLSKCTLLSSDWRQNLEFF